MSKYFYISNENNLNEEEKRTGCISYARLVERVTHNNIVLCNNIAKVDYSIFDNIDSDLEIYQYYLCYLSESDLQYNSRFNDCLIFGYSDMLDLYVLCVDHWGTSWDYVMTDIKWSTDLEKCLK